MATSIGVKLGIDGEAEYRKQLNNIITSTKTLDKQMTELKSSFTDETSAMEKNEKETELLQKKAEKLADEVEMMQKMVDAAAEKYGEASTECQKWEQSLAQAQTELNKTNAEITEHQNAAEQANSALGQLTAEIDEQTGELDGLKEAYVNAALEFGENSAEAEELARQITALSAELEENQSKLDAVTQAAEDLTNGSDEAKGALEALTDEIASQEAELDELRDSYIEAVLEFGEGSDEAQALAGQISNLSSELQGNKQKLDEATSSADGLTGSLQETEQQEQNVGTAIGEVAGMFDSNFGSIVNTIATADVAGLMMEIADKVLDVVSNLWEMQIEFDNAQADVAVMTGAVGADLQEMKNIATEAWAAVANKDSEEADYAAIVGNLNTRLGATGEDLKNLTELFGIYNATLGVDGAQAVNDLVDVMKKWGLASEDNANNYRTLYTLMGELTEAQSLSDISVTELAQHLVDQSGTFQELGMSIEDSIGFMVAYRDAGGNVSEITRAMDSTLNKLTGETDDLSGAWKDITKVLQTSNSKMAALSTTVGNTGKTVQDVLGTKLAGRIYDTFNSAGVNADEFTRKIEANANTSYNALSRSFQNSRTDMDNAYQWWRENIQAPLLHDWGEVADGAEDANSDITKSVQQSGDETKKITEEAKVKVIDDYSDIQTALDKGVQIRLNDDLGELKYNAGLAFGEVEEDYNALLSTLRYNPVKIEVEAPAIEYSVSGTGANARYTPYATPMRFAEAYDRAMILNAPTIFGAMGNRLLVGGDRAGNEVVVGEQHLMDMFTQAIRSGGGAGINVVVNAAPGMNENEVADYVINRLQMELIGSEMTYAQ